MLKRVHRPSSSADAATQKLASRPWRSSAGPHLAHPGKRQRDLHGVSPAAHRSRIGGSYEREIDREGGIT